PTKKFSGNNDTFGQAPRANGHPESLTVLNAVAEFERDLLIERTQAGIARARAEGKAMGRPSALTKQQQDDVRQHLSEGVSVASLAKRYGTSRQTIMRVRDSA
ncbi:helix-turn-helix domain-containing protein, partial [Burkholderia anthina]|uniref:helix-turn-helix domain-containing protein n=1 Tax=Burkholderia anthina TaxID=179879 RepID=UPI000F9505C6